MSWTQQHCGGQAPGLKTVQDMAAHEAVGAGEQDLHRLSGNVSAATVRVGVGARGGEASQQAEFLAGLAEFVQREVDLPVGVGGHQADAD